MAFDNISCDIIEHFFPWKRFYAEIYYADRYLELDIVITCTYRSDTLDADTFRMHVSD
jgi:hypothetical protein